ncbi:MAG: hypothetical protein GY913_08360 [Proteobacteria bacterium]|nr:hypothetical protein [Pseudomonadota bacterium]MCP4916922.1 hypothetical protein [Pseudomonadota bacterium]
MSPLSTLLAWSVRNAPPVAVPDARRHLAVTCVEACESTADLTLELDRRARKRGRLPRTASTEVYTLDVLPNGMYGIWADSGSEFLLVTLAGPTVGSETRTHAWEEQIAAWAEAEGGLIHDLDTHRVESASDFLGRSHPVDRMALDWSEDGTRVVTRGLRIFGLHELVVEDVPEGLGQELSTVLAWLVADMLDERGPHESRTLTLEDLDAETAAWVAQAIWYEDDPGVVQAGTREGVVRLSNAVPGETDPAPPVLTVDFGTAGLIAWLDVVLGKGTLEPDDPWESPS